MWADSTGIDHGLFFCPLSLIIIMVIMIIIIIVIPFSIRRISEHDFLVRRAGGRISLSTHLVLGVCSMESTVNT